MFAARPFDRGDEILALDTSRVVSEANPLRPERGESEDHLALLEEWFVEKHSDEVAKLEAEAQSIGGGDEFMV